MEADREKYERFFAVFGQQLKFGIVADYGMKKSLLSDLLLYWSAQREKMVSLKEYVAAMPEEQKYIYYASAETAQRAAALPQTEQVRARGYDILCFVSDADEFVAEILGEYEGKSLRNVCSNDLGLESDEEKQEAEKANEEMRELLDFVLGCCEGRVVNVKITNKLKNHAVCLSAEGDITLEMERYFRTIPGVDPNAMKARRVLELNAAHSAVKALEAERRENPERARIMAQVLLTQAELTAGYAPADPAAYTELVCSLF